MPGCQRIPQRRHVELVANSETGNTGLTKGRVCMPYRGFCVMRCAPLEIIVPRLCPDRKKFLAPPLKVSKVLSLFRLVAWHSW